MARFNALLNLRLRQKKVEKNKMTALAERSTSGNLSGFSGVFRVSPLSNPEKNALETILKSFREDENYNVNEDLNTLMTITSEVKAITNQAIILHGERIKKAQEILKNYQEGAFTAWLVVTYGNRQTPYNFLQYYEFYRSMPPSLHPKIDEMPRQAIYTLASRSGDHKKKEEIVSTYNGQPKQELLTIIRKIFPLPQDDKRLADIAHQTIGSLKRIKNLLRDPLFRPSKDQKREMKNLLEQLRSLVDKS